MKAGIAAKVRLPGGQEYRVVERDTQFVVEIDKGIRVRCWRELAATARGTIAECLYALADAARRLED